MTVDETATSTTANVSSTKNVKKSGEQWNTSSNCDESDDGGCDGDDGVGVERGDAVDGKSSPKENDPLQPKIINSNKEVCFNFLYFANN